MTERTANVRVNVRGNAAAELGKIEKSVAGATDKARDANGRFLKAGQAIDAAAGAAKRAKGPLEQAAAATNRAGDAFRKLGASSITANARFAATANGARSVANANQRATVAAASHAAKLETLARATDKANVAMRNFGANRGPNAQLAFWDRITSKIREATTQAGRFVRALPSSRLNMGGAQFGTLAAGVGSLAGSALDTGRGFASSLGVPGRDQLVAQRNNTDIRLARLTAQVGMNDAQAAALRSDMIRSAREAGVDPAEILSLYETGQGRFSDLASYRQNAGTIARAARGTGAQAGDIGAAIGEFQRQMGVGAGDVQQLIGIMTAGAAKGSVEASDIAGEFSTSIGTYQRVTGENGLAGARNMLGLAQVLGASGAGGAGTAVLTQNLLAKMSQADVLRGFQRAGVRTHENGRFVGFDAFAQQLLSNRRFVGSDGQINAGAIQRIIGSDMQANQALGVLLSEARKGNTVGSIASVSAEEGNRMIVDANRRIDASAGGQAANLAANAAANFDQNGEQLVRSMTSMAAQVTELDTRFPELSAAVDVTRGSFDTLRTTLSQVSMINLANGMNNASGAANTAATGLGGLAGRVSAAVGAFAAFQMASQATLGLLDGAMREGALGERLRREGGSASQDFADFSVARLLTGGYDVFGDRATGGTPEEIRRRVEENARRTQSQASGGPAAADPATSANTAATERQTAAMESHTRATERLTAELRASRGGAGDTADAGR